MSSESPTAASLPAPVVATPRPLPTVPGSLLVSAFPLVSGHGLYVQKLFDLGVFDRLSLFKIRNHDSEEGYSSVVRPRLPLSYASAFLSLYFPGRWSRAVEGASWVHYTSPHFFPLARYNARASGTVHDLIYLDRSTHNRRDTPRGTRLYFPRVFRYLDRLAGVVVISRAVEEAVKARYPGVATTVIHQWTQDFFQPRDREAARRQLGLPLDRKILLQVSIDNFRKNLEVLPKIMEKLGPEYALLRIGDSTRIRAQFSSGQLIERATVPPKDYPSYFNAADALLMPSLDEGFGLPVIEALNSGIPVVASDIVVFREVLGPSYPYLAPPHDVPRWVELTRASIQAAASDPACARLYAGKGSYYRAGRAAQEYREFYRKLGLPVGG